jgi:hypothetical protein
MISVVVSIIVGLSITGTIFGILCVIKDGFDNVRGIDTCKEAPKRQQLKAG